MESLHAHPQPPALPATPACPLRMKWCDCRCSDVCAPLLHGLIAAVQIRHVNVDLRQRKPAGVRSPMTYCNFGVLLKFCASNQPCSGWAVASGFCIRSKPREFLFGSNCCGGRQCIHPTLDHSYASVITVDNQREKCGIYLQQTNDVSCNNSTVLQKGHKQLITAAELHTLDSSINAVTTAKPNSLALV